VSFRWTVSLAEQLFQKHGPPPHLLNRPAVSGGGGEGGGGEGGGGDGEGGGGEGGGGEGEGGTSDM